jgi:hypothetical protein
VLEDSFHVEDCGGKQLCVQEKLYKTLQDKSLKFKVTLPTQAVDAVRDVNAF